MIAIQARIFIAALGLAASGVCTAAPEEIQVYLDEFAESGKFGLGKATGGTTDRWLGKAIFGMPLD
jgi:hypothetical protein